MSSSRRSRPCANCGYDGPFPASPDASSARDSLPSFAGARAKLATATQDLFRLSGTHSLPVQNPMSNPVEASVSEPPAGNRSEGNRSEGKGSDSPKSSARKPEASIMFSLEALMKANQAPAKADGGSDDASSQLWDMQSAEPLFGTAADEALLTTPFKMEPAQSMDSMTLPSETPNARRWWPIAIAATAGLALAAGGISVFGSGGAATASAASEQAKLEAAPLGAPPAVLPAPGSAEPVATSLPGDPGRASAEPGSSPVAANTALAEGSITEASVEASVTAGSVTPVSGTEGVGNAPGSSAAKAADPAAAGAPKEKEKPSSRKPPARAVAARAPAPVSSSALIPFDKAAAKAALNTAATQAASCGAGGAPGKGKIQVTFGTNGKVSDAQLVEGPFAGSVAGKCALRHFRAAKVPAFAGSPVSVAKSFKVD